MSIPISLPTFAQIVRICFQLSTSLELLYLPTELNCLLKTSLSLAMHCTSNSILSDISITLVVSYFFILIFSNFPQPHIFYMSLINYTQLIILSQHYFVIRTIFGFIPTVLFLFLLLKCIKTQVGEHGFQYILLDTENPLAFFQAGERFAVEFLDERSQVT